MYLSILKLKHNLQCDDIRRWDLRKVIRMSGKRSHCGISGFGYQYPKELALLPCEDTLRDAVL